MNKLQTQFLTLLALMLMGTGTANAATDYGIYVGETKVTSDNASNILGNGQFSYNASTKTLTVTNANLNNQGSLGSGIRNDAVDGLTIRLVGTSTLTTRMNAISSYKNFSITGTGTLNVTAGSRGIITYGQSAVTCTINGPTLNITASNYAFEDYYGTTTLSVKGANTRVTLNTGSTRNAVNNLKSFSVSDGLTIVYPQNATFDSSLKTIAYNGTACKGTVAIGITYGLYIGETMVNSYNYDDVNGDGMFAYRPASKTLDVRSGTLTNTGTLGTGISNREIDGLTIHITGTTVNINARQNAIHSNKNFKITGPGTLNATSTNSSAIYFTSSQNITCTISTDANGKSPRINAKGYSYAIHDYYGTCTLALEGANTVLTLEPGTGYAAVNNLMNLTFADGLAIVSPTGGASPYFNSSLKTITVDGATGYKGKIEMAYDYGMYIGETRVSKINYTDILGNGQFKYDPSSKTLTVNNANLRNEGSLGNGIDNREIDGLTINLTGTSTITTRNSAIATSKSISIKGSGTLNATAQYAPGISFWGTGNKTCTVSGPKLNIISNSHNAIDDNSGNTGLKLEGANTVLTLQPGSNYAAVNNLMSMTFADGLDIVTPSGPSLAFYPNLHSISVNGREAYQGKVEIAYDYGIFVGETKVSKLNYADVLGNGQFKYDPETKTLNVENATLDNQGAFGSGIDNRLVDNLTINLTGTNKITARNSAVSSTKSISFTGSGTLNAYGKYSAGLCFWDSGDKTCYVNGPTLNFSSDSNALIDHAGNTTLAISGSGAKVTLEELSGNVATVHNLKNLSLDGYFISQPAGAYFSPSLKSITTDGSTPTTDKVVISDIGIWIDRTKVTADNCDDILGNGQLSYNIQTKTLIMDNFNYSGTSSNSSVITTANDLTINVVGTNTISSNAYVIGARGSLTFTGTGSLTLEVNSNSRVSAIALWTTDEDTEDHLDCTFDGPSVTIISPAGSAFSGNLEDVNRIIVKGSTTQLDMQQDPSMRGNGCLYLIDDFQIGDGLYVTEPYGAYFDANLKDFTLDGTNEYKGRVVIGPAVDYGFLVADEWVTTANANDVLGNGQFSYDPAKNVLTMKDANLTKTNGTLGTGIDIRSTQDLTINIEGTNYIKTRNEPIASIKSFRITGTGTLEAIAAASEGILFWSQDTMTCTVNGPKINIQGLASGLVDYYNTATLRVEGSTTSLSFQPITTNLADWSTQLIDEYQEEDFFTIKGLRRLVMDNEVSIIEPEGGRFEESLQSITIDGRNAYKGKVTIGTNEDYGFYVAETRVKTNNANDILGDGCFSYDPASKTLYVRNANLDNQGALGSGISNREVEGMTIVLEGDNYFNTRMNVIGMQKSTTIIGRGTLTATSTDGYGLSLTEKGSKCVINGPKLDFKVRTSPISCYRDSIALIVEGAQTEISMESTGGYKTIDNLSFLMLGDGLYITEPADGWFSEDVKSVTVDGTNPYMGKVTIGTKEEETVKGDVNGDTTVDVADIASVISVMAGTAEYAAADVNGDGTTDVADIATIISIMAEQARIQRMLKGEAEE